METWLWHLATRMETWVWYLATPLEGQVDAEGVDSRYGVAAVVYSEGGGATDRKSTRLNSSHGYISYAVFCLKKYCIGLRSRPHRIHSRSPLCSP